MKRLLSAAIAPLCCALLPAVVAAAPTQEIATLPIGQYVCDLPGDALGPAGMRQPEAGFAILNASSYRAEGGGGSYLLSGDVLTMTSGVRRGQRYHRLPSGLLRLIGPDGMDSPLRCYRLSRNNR